MALKTHQAYKSYATTGKDLEVSPAGNSIPSGYPDPSTVKGIEASEVDQYEADGFTVIANADWPGHLEAFQENQYFLDLISADDDKAIDSQLLSSIERREAAGRRVRRKITIMMDKLSLQGDPVATGLATWRAAGDSRETMKTKLLDLMKVQSDSYSGVAAILSTAGQMLEDGSLQRALLYLLGESDSIPAPFLTFYNAAIDLILDEAINVY